MTASLLLKNPLVSVCIPTFNNGGMIEEAINSVLKQTYKALEIWILDNCSTDATEAIVLAMMVTEPRIKYARHAHNMGMALNFNSCLSFATGDLVLILGADDSLEEDCIMHLANALHAHPTAVLAGCAREFVDEAMKPIRVIRRARETRLIDGKKLMRECVALGNKIGEPSAVLFRRKPADRGFNTEFNQFLDLEMWFYLASMGDGIFLPEPLTKVRQHSLQTSKSNFKSGRLIDEKRRLFLTVFQPSLLQLRVFDKIMWDVRMAVSVARFMQIGGIIEPTNIRETYYRFIYLICVPAIRIVLFAKRVCKNFEFRR